MSLSNEQEKAPATSDGASGGTAGMPASAAQAAGPVSSSVPTRGEFVRGRLAEELNTDEEGADPVAALDAVMAAVADEPSHAERARGSAVPKRRGDIAGAIQKLASVALDMDDPVRSLEEGVESLAEALAARDIAAESHHLAAREREVDERAAYRHARFHRVTELIDAGHSLDQAVVITNANEAEVRARAMATGSDPMEPIHRYAVLNGYRSSRPASPIPMTGGQPPAAAAQYPGVNGHVVEMLARLSDEGFIEATKGDRWQKLMRQ